MSVGVDVDALKYYFQIHGLDVNAANDAAWRTGVPRFLELFDDVGCKATFYCVASDLGDDIVHHQLKAIVQSGHEVGNHTLDHDYALTRMMPQDIYEQVAESRLRLEEAAQTEVVGFRQRQVLWV